MRRLAFPFVVCAVLTGLLTACGGDDDSGAPAVPVTVTVVSAGTDPAIEGVQLYDIGDYTHVGIGNAVAYVDRPPVGGTHWVAPGWAECGFYDTPIPDEAAVHDLEHGVVWVTYRSDLAPGDLEILQELVRTDGHLIVSPYADLRTPIVATAWGAQLDLPEAGDGRLVQFIAAYTNADRAPEAGATCGEGRGVDPNPLDLD